VKDVKDEKSMPWVYVALGAVAIGLSLYYMSIESTVLDWAILVMGAIALFLGVRQLFLARKKP